MSFDGIKEISNTAPPAPAKGALILEWAKRLVRWCNSERILWGAGFLVTPGPHGKAVEFIPGPGNRAFTVSRSTNATLSIQGGFAQTQTGTLTAVTAVEEVAVAANLAVFARYDLGLAGTSTPGWEVVSGSIIQTGSTLPTYDARYRVIPIAAVTWDGTATAISGIVQHHTGTLPCPDMTPAGTIDFYNSATVPHGWRLMTEAEEFFFVGYKSGHADYGTVGNTGGFKLHGVTENNHAKHWHDTLPNITTESVGTVTSTLVPGAISKTVVTAVNWTGVDGCPTGSIKWCDSENDTDNRPPWYVVAYKIHL